MFSNYLKIALRHIGRDRLGTLIEVAGLTAGLVCALLTVLYVESELSFDRWIPGSGRVYRVETTLEFPGSPPQVAPSSSYILGTEMAAEVPGVSAVTRLTGKNVTIEYDGRRFSDFVVVVDPNFFDVVKLPFVEGDPAMSLRRPDSIVLSQSAAAKYFGGSPAVGKVLKIDSDRSLVVTGIIRDIPYNSHLQGDVFVSMNSALISSAEAAKDDWLQLKYFLYARLNPGVSPADVIAAAAGVFRRHFHNQLLASMRRSGDQVARIRLTPLDRVHLSADGGMRPPGNWMTIDAMECVAAAILLMACFNFINLATARSTIRSKEVALRKVVGALRYQIIVQFLSESMLLTLLATFFALMIAEIVLPAFDNFVDRQLTLQYFSNWPFILSAAAIAVITGCASGLYPAVVLSRFQPAMTLHAHLPNHAGSGGVRLALVVLQFAISIALGVGAIAVYAQIEYVRNLDPGFDPRGLFTIETEAGPPLSQSARDTFVNLIGSNPDVTAVAQSSAVPLNGNGQIRMPTGRPDAGLNQNFRAVSISPDFPRAYGFHLIAGRLLDGRRGSDETAKNDNVAGIDNGQNVLINETAARNLGFTAGTAVGKTILVADARATIAGVVADAMFDGPQQAFMPMLFYCNPARLSYVTIRAKNGRLAAAKAAADDTWKRVAPTADARQQVLDDALQASLRDDLRMEAILAVLVVAAVALACLGVLGLSAFAAERRTKEMGIRKVFGAQEWDVVRLLMWQFSLPILLASVIAWPVAWYILRTWLEKFAFKIPLSPFYFLAASALTLLLAWATTAGHAWRVARSKPIDALRYE